jgi:hypothetical protein
VILAVGTQGGLSPIAAVREHIVGAGRDLTIGVVLTEQGIDRTPRALLAGGHQVV